MHKQYTVVVSRAVTVCDFFFFFLPRGEAATNIVVWRLIAKIDFDQINTALMSIRK